MISFEVDQCERQLIEAIAERALRMLAHQGQTDRNACEFEMDITAAHANGNPLDLNRLLAADDFNFAHDVFGIVRHLNRDTGGLMGFFSPRFSRKEAA